MVTRISKGEKTPFEFGSTVSKSTFTNREQDLEQLKVNLVGGINTILISPRRWGKSSLVERTSAELLKEHDDIRVAHLDLFTTGSYEEFLENYSTEVIKVASTKWEDQLRNAKQIFKQVVPRLSIGAEPTTEMSISFDWQEVKNSIDDILDMPERLAKKNKVHLIICIDEFQNLLDWSDHAKIEKQLRAYWQRHKNVTYCLFGSKRHMMTGLFHGKSKPFYRFGDIIWLQKIAEEHWVPFIVKRFKSTKRSISKELASTIARTMQCHPWYVQQLAHYTWALTRTEVTRRMIQTALERAIATNSPLYQLEVEVMNRTQVNILKAISNGETQLTSKAVMDRFRLGTPRNVQKARKGLEGQDTIEKKGDQYVILDPGFDLWFKREFLGMKPQLASPT